MPLKPDDTLLSRFRITSVLGQGAFGCTYLAFDQRLRRPVAIKELLSQHLADQTARERFVNEARVMGQLAHPNIVTVYDLIEPDPAQRLDAYYIIMEYLDGGSLEHAIREGMTIERAIAVAVAVCAALARAHQNGIIHRDIKPANVLLSKDGSLIKLGDFGIAHLPDVHRAVGGHPGTLAYMSPEQTQSGAHVQLDGRSDLYSTGTMLYEMLTGRLYLDFSSYVRKASLDFYRAKGLPPGVDLSPFLKLELEMAIQQAVSSAVREVPPEDPRRHNPDVPAPLAELVLKALSKDPAGRFADAEEMIAALKGVKGRKLAQTTTPGRLSPGQHVDDLIARSQAAAQRGELSAALELLAQAHDLAPDSARVHCELGLLQVRRGDYRTAAQEWKEVISLDRTYARAYLELARCYNQLELYARAIEVQEEALRAGLAQGEPAFYDCLAMAYWMADRPEEAIWALENAIRLEDSPKRRALLRQWRRKSGGTSRARSKEDAR